MVREINYFKVYFPQPDFKLFDLMSLFMGAMTVIAFVKIYVFDAADETPVYWGFPLVITIFFIFKYFQSKRTPSASYSAGLFVCGLIFFIIAGGSTFLITIGLFYLVASFVERYAKSVLEIEFNENEIIKKKLFKTYLSWQVLSNLVLKDNMLTIDYKNNKIFQKEIAGDVSAELEREFNEFCTLQLKVHGSKLAVN